MIISGIIMVLYPESGYLLVVMILDITLLAYGIKSLVYYFTMARYMVGGQACLYKGIIALDFGIFAFNLDDLPKRIVLLYLVGCMAFTGIIDVLHSLEARRLRAKNWKYECFYGTCKVLFAIAALFFHDSLRILTLIYSAGLFHSAISNIITAFRKTAIVYVN